MRQKCRHSGTVYDDSYRPWRYPNGLPVWECELCSAKRRLIVRNYSIARGAIKEQKTIYPYHTRVSR
jgi:hypothetical protein